MLWLECTRVLYRQTVARRSSTQCSAWIPSSVDILARRCARVWLNLCAFSHQLLVARRIGLPFDLPLRLRMVRSAKTNLHSKGILQRTDHLVFELGAVVAVHYLGQKETLSTSLPFSPLFLLLFLLLFHYSCLCVLFHLYLYVADR
jgi:hypothetical protein